ncbi:MAG TPA: hypothetical protein QGF05_09865 [Dehalococcoidia bacterium]|nr:hypothetical protein [Dehalococcoidia bacterium]
MSLRDIASRIGDKHATVRRLYRGIKLLEQAESQTRFDREDRVRNRFYFSHLYTAAHQDDFQKFLGISADGSLKPDPVPKKKLPNLENLMIWLYGRSSQDIQPVVRSQNPDLNTLREVVSSQRGVAMLLNRRSLKAAHDASLGEERRFREALVQAHEELITAAGTVTTGYAGDPELLDVAESVVKLSDRIYSDMRSTKVRSRSRARRK